jgi:hypothetical protein
MWGQPPRLSGRAKLDSLFPAAENLRHHLPLSANQTRTTTSSPALSAQVLAREAANSPSVVPPAPERDAAAASC